jgi:AraC family transcriptional regulator, arabinose operon regulatory protein
MKSLKKKSRESVAGAAPCGGRTGLDDGKLQSSELWRVRFLTTQPMEAFPQLQLIRAERQTTPAYHYEGRFRSSERNCVFKYTLAGEGMFQVGRKKHPLPAGSGFLCKVSDPATAYYYPPDGRVPWEFVYINITGSIATAMTREFARRYGHIYQLPVDVGFIPELLAWQRHNQEEISVAPAEGAQIVASLFTALSQSKIRIDAADAGFALVMSARRLIHRYLHRFCNVKILSAELGVSREHLGRVFKEQTGQSPYRYLQRQKMIEACRLLKETRLTQKEIAQKIGFEVPTHFTRAFLRVMHMAPSRFRAVGVIPIQ